MTNQEAIGILAIVVETANGRCFIKDEAISDAYGMAIKALKAISPCDLCVNNPPSSMDGKPCSCCPAEPYREDI